MLVVIYITVVVCGWMIFRVRAEDLESAQADAEDTADKDSDTKDADDLNSRH